VGNKNIKNFCGDFREGKKKGATKNLFQDKLQKGNRKVNVVSGQKHIERKEYKEGKKTDPILIEGPKKQN